MGKVALMPTIEMEILTLLENHAYYLGVKLLVQSLLNVSISGGNLIRNISECLTSRVGRRKSFL